VFCDVPHFGGRGALRQAVVLGRQTRIEQATKSLVEMDR
jgi:hypothetical protein